MRVYRIATAARRRHVAFDGKSYTTRKATRQKTIDHHPASLDTILRLSEFFGDVRWGPCQCLAAVSFANPSSFTCAKTAASLKPVVDERSRHAMPKHTQ